MNKEKIKEWLKSNENKLLILLIVFTVVIRLYYFFKLGNQPIWWDEADYMAISKVWALNMPQPEWWQHFTGSRPLLMSFIWYFFMKLNLGELSMRFFTLLLPSIFSVYLVYAIGRDLYNKKIGLISGLIMSVYWVQLFYSFRLLTDIPALFLGLLTIYFFLLYFKKNRKYAIYLSVLFGVLAFSARFPLALVLISCFLFLLFVKKASFFKSKTIWKSLGFLFICLLPYIIYFMYSNFYVFQFYQGESTINTKILPFIGLFGMFPMFFKIFFLILLILGSLTFFNFISNLDLFWKQRDEKLNSDFFVLLWIIIHLLFYVLLSKTANDRWLLMLMPALFFVVAKGILIVYIFLKKYNKIFSIIIVFAILILGSYQQLSHANSLINIKKQTYEELKLSGEWLKENTPKDAKIISASTLQTQYYSERDTYGIISPGGGSEEYLFDQKVSETNPDYMIISLFELTYSPDWSFVYPQKHNMTLSMIYTMDEQKAAMYGTQVGTPILAIYKFN